MGRNFARDCNVAMGGVGTLSWSAVRFSATVSEQIHVFHSVLPQNRWLSLIFPRTKLVLPRAPPDEVKAAGVWTRANFETEL
jgi:hypothetical protein